MHQYNSNLISAKKVSIILDVTIDKISKGKPGARLHKGVITKSISIKNRSSLHHLNIAFPLLENYRYNLNELMKVISKLASTMYN